MSRLVTSLLVVASLATTVSCVSPLPVVRLDPTGNNVSWFAGRGVVARERNGLRVASAFDRQRAELLALRVEVQNASGTAIEIDPSQIAYMACAGPKDCSPLLPVEDPESRIAANDAAGNRARAAQANAETSGAVFVLLNAAGSATALASGNPSEAGEFADNALHASAHSSAESTRHADRIRSLDSDQINWQDAALRRTTLQSGQGIAGAVFLPIHPAANQVWMRVRLARETFWFLYSQRVQTPRP